MGVAERRLSKHQFHEDVPGLSYPPTTLVTHQAEAKLGDTGATTDKETADQCGGNEAEERLNNNNRGVL